MEDNVSNTISVTGIPKTATMEQVIEIEMQPCLLHYLFFFKPYCVFNCHTQT